MITTTPVTIYHKEYDTESRLDRWECFNFPKASWSGRLATAAADGGVSAQSFYTARIPTEAELCVKTGDYAVKGTVNEGITSPAALKKYEHFQIMLVSDNRRGSPMMRHWKLEGK